MTRHWTLDPRCVLPRGTAGSFDDCVVGDPCIDGRYWLLWSSTSPGKTIQAAWSRMLAGPWTVVKQPLVVPRGDDAPDGLNCDTPSAYWFADRGEALIYYMAYPKVAQAGQPGAP